MKKLTTSITITTLLLLSGCGGSGSDGTSKIELNTKEKLGEALFFDKNLSLRRNTSCATCHNPEHGFIDARFRKSDVDQDIFIYGALSVGDDGYSLGGRNAPTAAYAMFSPKFHKQKDGTYKGGQFYDGRAATLKDQAGGPPLDSTEMQMPNKEAVIDRIKENDEYVIAFKRLYGDDIFDDVDRSYDAMTEAIAKFEKTELFAPFDSKYDRLRDCQEAGGDLDECFVEGNWTNEEQLGYSLFFSTTNTNCARCHTLNSRSEAPLGTREMFTNYEYENIGSPKNVLAMNARVALGLQEKNATFKGLGATVEATDENYTSHLGKVKVPTLRNVAITGPYMSDGVFKELRTVLEFYDFMANNGDHTINPETGEPWGKNDYEHTINHKLLRATKPLTDDKIRALEAFLRTLTDKRYEHLLPPLKD